MTSIQMPEPHLLRHFPEATVLAVLDAALVAVELALRDEHPTADELPLDAEHDVAPSLVTVYLVLTRASELRDLIHLYSAAVRRAVRYSAEACLYDQDDHNLF